MSKQMVTSTLPKITIRTAARLLAGGLISSEELCSYCHTLAVLGEERWQLNAFTSLVPRQILLERARASDDRRRQHQSVAGAQVSSLEGIPVTVKSNLAVAEEFLTAGSRILQDGRPCGYDADVTSTLIRDNGAILIGMTNMDEFGMGSLGNNATPCQQTGQTATRNVISYLRYLPDRIRLDDKELADTIRMPRDQIEELHATVAEKHDDPMLSAGGSSCGSGVSVAHGSSLASLGTDTGGSVRLPAAWCEVVGLKPSYGLLSRHGVVSYASSLDTVGILAPSVDCAAVLLDALTHREVFTRDSTASFYSSSAMASSSDVRDHSTASDSLSGVVIGVPEAFSVEECPEDIRTAWARGADWLSSHGATVQVIDKSTISPHLVQNSLAAYYVLASAEASSNLSRYDGFRYGRPASPQDDTPISSTLSQLESQYSSARTEGFGKEVMRRVLCGTAVLSSDRFHTYYEAAAKLRAALTRDLNSALEEVDLLLIPTALSFPPSLDEELDSTETFANDIMTVPVSMAGLPVVSVPTSSDISRNVSLQLVGSRLKKSVVLEAGRVMERLRD